MLSIGLQSAVFFATALLLVAIPDDTGWSGAATAAGFAYVAAGTDLTSFAAAAMMALISLGCMWVLGRSLRGATARPEAPSRSRAP